jgi:hypothetical protein
MFQRLKNIIQHPVAAHIMALLGALTYLLTALNVARTTTSYLDEGLYLYKGLLFANGVYTPFQDYGVWTNQMPLSFLIPGYIQKWFGVGLPTARYFMIVLAMFTLLGLWILARRWGGHWWAAGIIWVMALNHAEIKVLSLSISEGPVALMVVWSLVFTLSVNRPRWQLWMGASLASLLILTRVNLAFLLPLLLLYLWWQYGFRKAFWAGVAALAVLAVGHAFFWPGILKFWASWLPRSLTPFLDPWRFFISDAQNGKSILYVEPVTPFTIFLYTWMTLRLHFVALFSAIAVWLLWPARLRRVTGRLRAAVFVSVLLIVLVAAHMWVSFAGGFCVSCILLYVVKFDFLGLILLAICWRFLVRDLPPVRRVIILTVCLVTIFGVGFSAYEDINAGFATSTMEVIRDTYLWNLLQNLFTIQPLMLFRQTFAVLVSALAVLGLGILLFVLGRRARDRSAYARRVGFTALNVMLILGLILTPTVALSKGNDFFACGDSDVFASYEKAGSQLRALIPPGSTIYWEGRILAIFLYLPDVNLYPPQLNHIHSFREGGEEDWLLRFSFWNEGIARRWLNEADFTLIEKAHLRDWEEAILESGGYIKIASTPKVEKCRWQSIIDVYQRVEP